MDDSRYLWGTMHLASKFELLSLLQEHDLEEIRLISLYELLRMVWQDS